MAKTDRANWRTRLGWVLPALLLLAALLVLGRELRQPSSILLFWPAWAETGALALVLTAIILTGGIDLSIGSTMALASVCLGQFWHTCGLSIWVAAALAVVVGALAGMGNGLLVVLGLPPLIATLATLAFYAGLALAISGGERISGLPSEYTAIGQDPWLSIADVGLPNQLWLLLLVLSATYIFAHHTRYGRYLYALGENRVAARFAMLPIKRLELALYVASGAMAGLVAVFYTARSGAAIPNAGQGRELEAIACVVVGGTRVTGGFGGILRTAFGVAVIAHLDIALQLIGSLRIHLPGMATAWQPSAESRLVILGVLMIAVVAWNERIGGRAEA